MAGFVRTASAVMRFWQQNNGVVLNLLFKENPVHNVARSVTAIVPVVTVLRYPLTLLFAPGLAVLLQFPAVVLVQLLRTD